MPGLQPHAADTAVLLFFALKNFRLPHHLSTIFKLGFQHHIFIGHRQHPPGNGQHFAHAAHCHIEGWGYLIEGRQKEIAKALSLQDSLRKTIPQQFSHHGFGVGKS